MKVKTRNAIAGSALAVIAALSMSACAPVGGDGVNQQPVANQAAAPDGSGAADSGADEDATDEGDSAGGDTGDSGDAGDAGDSGGDADNRNGESQDLTERLIAKSVKQMGEVVTDEKGWVMYRFDKDTPDPAKSNCNGDCEKVWPPAYTDGNPKLQGIDAEKVGSVTRADGTKQITLNGWPLYRYIGDKEPGQWKGQGVGGVWFVVAPDGKKNTSCMPEGTPSAVPPPGNDKGGNNDKGGGGQYGNGGNKKNDKSGGYGDSGGGGDYN
ncbi:hypothetical protein GCM10010124_19810 [Pilimelia terevasa]|uniref:Lipoprotein with Yx(FWY)xxD motif n=1 Tax=Pilimelia terevasa TaxID=53372 RepID=A0A8J3FH28_9ACTN|nr:hypothetical protein [Pilimelia terevasa]GGK27218.1 hypothetical protein GCM10010124_19810 [Pilimelia terevasa]